MSQPKTDGGKYRIYLVVSFILYIFIHVNGTSIPLGLFLILMIIFGTWFGYLISKLI